jgi:hypothetical protein
VVGKWDEMWGLMSRVAIGLNRKQERVILVIGIDEKMFKKGHNYLIGVVTWKGPPSNTW